jgi:hypothetical protein
MQTNNSFEDLICIKICNVLTMFGYQEPIILCYGC